MRVPIFCFPLAALVGCTPAAPAHNSGVDISAAAIKAQDTVDAYGANAGTGHAAVEIGEPGTANAGTNSNATIPVSDAAGAAPRG